jgi:hypothetical protein
MQVVYFGCRYKKIFYAKLMRTILPTIESGGLANESGKASTKVAGAAQNGGAERAQNADWARQANCRETASGQLPCTDFVLAAPVPCYNFGSLRAAAAATCEPQAILNLRGRAGEATMAVNYYEHVWHNGKFIPW